MLRIIINADDLGSSKNCNDAIFQLMAHGKISSSTLMANGPYFDDAVRHIEQFPQYSFGVHLNLSQFQPLTTANIFEKHNLIDHSGQFHFRKLIFPTPKLIRAIQNEWFTQVAKVRDYGIIISHFDSHQHMHTRLWMFPILKFLSQKFNIHKIRSKFGRYNCSRNGSTLRRLVRQCCGFPHRLIQTRALGFRSPDHFAGIHDGLHFFSTHSVKGPLTVELMCHPGVSGFELDFPTLRENYEHKIRSHYRLISYNEL
jgi:predicted glycoside hydrolase/deacetylase ChbG (UPF0249 family)